MHTPPTGFGRAELSGPLWPRSLWRLAPGSARKSPGGVGQLGGQQTGVLEHHMGQLPEQVVEDDQSPERAATAGSTLSDHTTCSASSDGGSAAGPQPQPGQPPRLRPAQEVGADRVIGGADGDQHVALPGQAVAGRRRIGTLEVHAGQGPLADDDRDARTRRRGDGRATATEGKRTTWWPRPRSAGPGSGRPGPARRERPAPSSPRAGATLAFPLAREASRDGDISLARTIPWPARGPGGRRWRPGPGPGRHRWEAPPGG